jgi:hypothetical protein
MRAILSTVLACGLAACAVDAPAPVTTEAESAEADVDVPAELTLHADTALAQSCTFIQWCDRPNSPEKIVCVLRPSCIDTCQTQRGRDSVVAKCQNDARAICGTSSGITYHGCNGLGPPLQADDPSE